MVEQEDIINNDTLIDTIIYNGKDAVYWLFSIDTQWFWTGVIVPITIAIIIAIIQKRKHKNESR